MVRAASVSDRKMNARRRDPHSPCPRARDTNHVYLCVRVYIYAGSGFIRLK